MNELISRDSFGNIFRLKMIILYQKTLTVYPIVRVRPSSVHCIWSSIPVLWSRGQPLIGLNEMSRI